MSNTVSTFFQAAVASALMIGCFAAGYALAKAENSQRSQLPAESVEAPPAKSDNDDQVACLNWVTNNFDKATVFTFAAICGKGGAPRM